MSRTYDAQSIIDLPQLDAGSASTIVHTMLIVAGKEKKLPASVAEARAELQVACDALDAALRASLPAGTPDDGAAIERVEIDTWTACSHWLAGLKDLPSTEEQPSIADRVYRALFGTGLAFLRGTPHKRWSETERRLQHIRTEKLGPDFATLGGAHVLAALERTHAATGTALGFTTVREAPDAPQIRAHFDALKTALRDYILQVVASVKRQVPATKALADALLHAITSYEPPASAKRAKPAPGEGQTPAPTKAAADESRPSAPATGEAAAAAGGTAREP